MGISTATFAKATNRMQRRFRQTDRAVLLALTKSQRTLGGHACAWGGEFGRTPNVARERGTRRRDH